MTKIRVLLLTPMRPGGDFPASTYVRLLQPLCHPSLNALIEAVPVTPDEALRAPGDAVVVQRTALPDESSAEALLRRRDAEGMRLVYEVDDDLFVNPPLRLRDSGDFQRRQAAARRIVGEADAITVTTHPLRSLMADLFGRPVHVVRNALDERLWLSEPAPRQSLSAADLLRRAGHGLLGGGDAVGLLYMGTGSHADDLALLRAPLRRLKREFGRRLSVDMIGVVAAGQREDWFRVKEIPRQAQANYPAFVQWLRGLAGYHIGLAPLLDLPFNHHKSDLKLFDYAALGLAPVLSDCPAYKDTAIGGETALLAGEGDGVWYDAIGSLIEDRLLMARIQAGARQDLLSHHTLAAQAEERRRTWAALVGRSADIAAEASERRSSG